MEDAIGYRPPHHRFGALLTISLTSCLLANPSAADAEQPKRNKADTSESAKRKVRPVLSTQLV